MSWHLGFSLRVLRVTRFQTMPECNGLCCRHPTRLWAAGRPPTTSTQPRASHMQAPISWGWNRLCHFSRSPWNVPTSTPVSPTAGSGSWMTSATRRLRRSHLLRFTSLYVSRGWPSGFARTPSGAGRAAHLRQGNGLRPRVRASTVADDFVSQGSNLIDGEFHYVAGSY